MNDDARLYAPATERNREAILSVLARALPASGLVLEVASGTGQHIAYFAQHLSEALVWQPTDIEPAHLASIAAWCRAAQTTNVRPPLPLDAGSRGWLEQGQSLQPLVGVLAINLIHISPWSVCLGLFAGVSRLLAAGGLLYLYGPYRRAGRHTAPSNESFDQSLRSQNPAWGVRDLEAVAAAADAQGLGLEEVVPMPAENFSVLFRRRG